LLGLGALTLLVGLFHHQRRPGAVGPPVAASQLAPGRTADASETASARWQASVASRAPGPALTAREIVAEKLARFGRSRRELALALAQRHQVQMPPKVERFFTAVESGNWEDINAAFKRLNGGDSSAGHGAQRSPEVSKLWPAIIDAYGAAEQVHLWPPQQLLDYGNALLGALRPGMVYVGGTDTGRWIPELLNESSDGERHIVLTQNGLADSTYLDYLRLQYDGALANLSEEDSQRAFQQYLADAQKRLEHDQQFPNEPKQVRPGEEIGVTDGRVQVSGQVAVMMINETLLQMLMQKNPDVSFAIQESFPFRSTYADALPLGPLMELNAASEQNTFTPERASATLDAWRTTAQQVLADPEAVGSDEALRSYSKNAVASARLLAAHGFDTQAEEAYRLALQICPYNPESAGGLADLLAGSGRANEARQLLDEFDRKYPDLKAQMERVRATATWLWTATAAKP
jgi:hypothetical protein